MPSSAFKKCALRSEEHTSELQSHSHIVCRLLLEKTQGTRRWRNGRPPPGWRTRLPGAPSARPDCPASACWALDAAVAAFRAQLDAGFFFNDTATTEISPLSLHDALPI